MEPSTHLSNRQETRGRTTTTGGRFDAFRTRAASFFTFTGTSSIGSSRSESNSPYAKPSPPRIGLRLFAGERVEHSRLRRDISHTSGRRSLSSTGSFIDPHAAPYRAVQPYPPSSIEMGENRQARGCRRERRRGNHPELHRSLSAPDGRRGGHFRAWMKPLRRNGDGKSKSRRFCYGPGIKSKAARKKLVDTALSGVLLAILFSTYLALSLSSAVDGREFHVVVILALILLTIYFCHSFIRLFMLAWRPAPEYSPPSVTGRIGTFGYAHPDRPIPVILARDEEVRAIDVDLERGQQANANENAGADGGGGGGAGGVGLAPPPPAYGLWRNSVKINPNLVYWQRREENHRHRHNQGMMHRSDNDGQRETNRPPSYMSDDGVRYVVDIQRHPQAASMAAQPRGFAPEEAVLHPSERMGRKR
ncbi:hypothetical protein FQN50_007566 [Emmonsiellopsis sp. PD_5]|nr:hypothetical protein FQN50_007566 [Emmonsiellopsis sp. PD_5]